MGRDYDYGAANSVHKFPYDAIPDFEPNFNTVLIHGQAKLTDLLSSAAIIDTGFLVSARLRGLLEQFTLPLHRFYPVPTTYRHKPVAGYFWLQLPEPHLALTEGSSVAEAEAAITGDPELAAVDLLRVYHPSRFAYCFVSDPLRRAIESAGITGVRFGTAKVFRSSAAEGAPDQSLNQTRPP
jgi:hypothetical protein